MQIYNFFFNLQEFVEENLLISILFPTFAPSCASNIILKTIISMKRLKFQWVLVAFLILGNSGGDCSMHNYGLSNVHKSAAFMLIADDDVRDHANPTKANTLGEQWRQMGYYVISMKNDFKTIYGEGVEKTEFTFE